MKQTPRSKLYKKFIRKNFEKKKKQTLEKVEKKNCKSKRNGFQ